MLMFGLYEKEKKKIRWCILWPFLWALSHMRNYRFLMFSAQGVTPPKPNQ